MSAFKEISSKVRNTVYDYKADARYNLFVVAGAAGSGARSAAAAGYVEDTILSKGCNNPAVVRQHFRIIVYLQESSSCKNCLKWAEAQLFVAAYARSVAYR